MRRTLLSVALLLPASGIGRLAAQVQVMAIPGIVRDSAADFPIAGAIVELQNVIFRGVARTDESGAFVVTGVEAGTYKLTVIRIGYLKVEREIDIGSAGARLTIVMAPLTQSLAPVRVTADGAGIYGVVGTAADLKPLSGVTVFVAGTNGTIATDSAGGFFVPVKKAGMYFVRMTKKGYGQLMFPIDVPADHVVDASRLLDTSSRAPIAEGLILDLDQRLRWRSNNSALVTGSEIRKAGGSMSDALATSPSLVAKGLRLGGNVCVLLDGVPRPGVSLDSFRPEEIEAVEVYAGNDMSGEKEVLAFLQKNWPRGAPCSGDRRRIANPDGPDVVRYVSIWTRR